MNLNDILAFDRTLFAVNLQSKKKAFELIAETFALSHPTLDETTLFDSLVIRERLGNTAVGGGVAVPHCRLSYLKAPLGCFIHCKKGIDYDAEDHLPVDLIFALIVPEEAIETHLELLALISEHLCQDIFKRVLREANSREELYQRLISA